MGKTNEMLMDETGYRSTSRVGIWIVMVFTLVMIALDFSIPGLEVPEPAYVILGTMFTFFAVWAMGPRMAEYIGPQLGAVIGGLGASRRTRPDVRPEPDAETMVRRHGTG